MCYIIIIIIIIRWCGGGVGGWCTYRGFSVEVDGIICRMLSCLHKYWNTQTG